MQGFEEVYRQHVQKVFRFCLRLVGRPDIAEELTSEAFLVLYRNFARVDTTQLPSWLFTVARNLAMDYWRHRAVEERHLTMLSSAEAATEAPHESWLFENPSLKPIHRVCLILRYVQDMDRSEIAERTGLSENQVKGHLQYARRLLRKALMSETK
jgi:RNA polymerase sigma-70 factor, ECF subfamily